MHISSTVCSEILMASFIGGRDACCPESTISISSLLASCSLGSTSNSSQALGSSIHYKDRLYDSASKALEAYIEDYEESLLSPVASTGKIIMRTVSAKSNYSFSNPLSKQTVPRVWNGPRDSFSSPSTRRVTVDTELASLTTDDLLGFPSDGSLPSDQTFIPLLESRKQRRRKPRSSSLKKHTPSQSASSLDCNTTVGFSDLASVADKNNSTHRDSLKKKQNLLEAEQVMQPHGLDYVPPTLCSRDWHHEVSSVPLSSKHYPRWLTSQKSDLNVSGITSIPDSKYPVWLKNYNLLSDSGSQNVPQSIKTTEECSFMKHTQSINASFLDQLDRFNPVLNNGHCVDSEGNHEGLSRNDQYAIPGDPEYFLPKDLSMSRHSKEPFKDDQIELLILKAERTLESSMKGFPAPVKNCSPETEDILEADRSWEKIPVTFKSPIPVFCEEDGGLLETTRSNHVQDFLKDCLKNGSQLQESTLSGGNHHGPVEALKQMLFNLQTVQQSFAHDKSIEENEEMKKLSEEATLESKLFDQEMMPVNNSLQRALRHLSRLKELVEETGVKQGQSLNLGDKN